MDCRSGLFFVASRRWLFATLCFSFLAAGCAQKGFLAQGKEPPKKQPKACTCVALGNCHYGAGIDPERAPGEKEQLLEQARRAYMQALKIDPTCMDAYVALGRLNQHRGEHENAVANYESGLKVLPKSAVLRFELGMCQAKHKDWESAQENFRLASELEPDNRSYGNTYAYCLARMGRYEQSLACFQKAVGTARAHYNLARMLQHLHQEGLSVHHLHLSLKANPQLAEAREMLSEIESGPRPAASGALVGIEFLDEGNGPSNSVPHGLTPAAN